MPRLKLDDGYTIKDRTPAVMADGREYPVIHVEYRPALPVAIADWRYKLNRAPSGAEEVQISADFLEAHLVSWDVVDKADRATRPTADLIHLVPEPILKALVEIVLRWAPRSEEALKNSAAG